MSFASRTLCRSQTSSFKQSKNGEDGEDIFESSFVPFYDGGFESLPQPDRELTDEELCVMDLNSDGMINVIDIVALVNIILDN